MTYFARALGAAHLGDAATVRASLDGLQQARDRLTQANEPYWAEQVEIQRLGATAWLALVEGRKQDALTQMRTAASREDATEKSAVTPGPLAPARELVGEMLLQMNEPAQALKEFEATLKKEPNRFRALAGAAKSAAAAGDRATARKYYDQLVKICVKGDTPGRPELQEARRAVGSRSSGR
jgi:tetratricopeptide (TPR) repeat protein